MKNWLQISEGCGAVILNAPFAFTCIHTSPQKMEGSGVLKTVHPIEVANWFHTESERFTKVQCDTSGCWAPQGKDALPSVSTLQALTSPHKATKVDGIAMYHRISPRVESRKRNWGRSEILSKSRCASDQVEEQGKNQEGKHGH